MLHKYGFGDVGMWQGVGDENLFLELFVQHVKDWYKLKWHSTLHDMSKMSVYCTFKTVFNCWKIFKCAFKILVLKPKPWNWSSEKEQRPSSRQNLQLMWSKWWNIYWGWMSFCWNVLHMQI